MPSFSADLNSIRGYLRPIVGVFIGLEPSSESSAADGTVTQKLNTVYAKGLIDTGATHTSITQALAEKIKAVPCKQVPIHSATHNSVLTNVYKVTLIIGVANNQSGAGVPELYSKPMVREVAEFVSAGAAAPDIDILIGMDIISESVLVISGHDKRLTMSF